MLLLPCPETRSGAAICISRKSLDERKKKVPIRAAAALNAGRGAIETRCVNGFIRRCVDNEEWQDR